MIQVPCTHCGSAVNTFPSVLRRNTGKVFCSRECWQKSKLVQKVCAQCGGSFTLVPSAARKRPAAFCSQSCAGKARWSRPRIPCAECGKIFVRVTRRKYFCSQACSQAEHTRKRAQFKCTHCGNRAGASRHSVHSGQGLFSNRALDGAAAVFAARIMR